jgi:DNA topoisomerase IB
MLVKFCIIKSSKPSLPGLHQSTILLNKMTILEDDRKELGNGFWSQTNSSGGKTTKGISYSAQAFLAQVRR